MIFFFFFSENHFIYVQWWKISASGLALFFIFFFCIFLGWQCVRSGVVTLVVQYERGWKGGLFGFLWKKKKIYGPSKMMPYCWRYPTMTKKKEKKKNTMNMQKWHQMQMVITVFNCFRAITYLLSYNGLSNFEKRE